MNLYLYFAEVLLIILLSLLALNQNIKYSSLKIKMWYSISLIFIVISFFMRLYMFLSPSLVNLYLFKHIYYLNYLGIIMGSFIAIFIFLRSNKLKFDYIKFMFFCTFIVYAILVYSNAIQVKLMGGYGYFMSFSTSYYQQIFKFLFTIILIILGIYIIRNKFKDRIGGSLILLCGVLGFILYALIDNYEYIITGEALLQLIFIITINYSIIKLKK